MASTSFGIICGRHDDTSCLLAEALPPLETISVPRSLIDSCLVFHCCAVAVDAEVVAAAPALRLMLLSSGVGEHLLQAVAAQARYHACGDVLRRLSHHVGAMREVLQQQRHDHQNVGLKQQP